VSARHHAHLDLDRADLGRRAAVRATLLDRDLLPDEALVDRLAGTLDVALRERVLDDRLTVDGGGADRERQLDALDDVLEQQVPLRGLQLLRVLLGVGQAAQLVLELLAHDRLDGDHPLLLEDLAERHPHLQLAHHPVLVRVHRRCADFTLDDLLYDRSGLAQPLLLDPRPDLVAALPLELLGDRRVEPLRLAALRAQLELGVAELDDLAVRDLERLEEPVLRNLVRARLDHRQAVLRPDDDQIEVGVLDLGERRVHDEVAVQQPHPHGPDRAEEREGRHGQRRRDGVDREDVVRVHQIGREDRGDALRLVAVALRPERPDGAVSHACGEDCALGGAPLTLEKAARDLPGGVHALLDVDREREEVRALARLRPALRRAEDDGVAAADEHCAVRLLRELPRLE